MQIFVIDAFGLAGIAAIYHNRDRRHPLYATLAAPQSSTDRYVTTEVGIITAFAMVADLQHDGLMAALKQVLRYFFIPGMPGFQVFRFDNARIAQDFGDFIRGHGSTVPLAIGSAAFICSEIFTSKLIGKNHQFYAALKLDIEHAF